MGVVGTVGTAIAGADTAKVDAASLPKSLHGAVETKAFTAGTVLPPLVPLVGSLLFDPGPAYAYSTLDRDDYGGGSLNYTMTARGANLDPGTIAAGGVFWPAPDCTGPDAPNVSCITSGGSLDKGENPGTGIDTGLEAAKGWPLYAEALYPDQPGQPSNQQAYKCIFNKDVNDAPPTKGQFSEACKSGGDSVPMTAWATTIGDNVTSEAFSRGLGVAAPGAFSFGNTESHSLVTPETGGVLHSTGYATINSIDIGGGQIHIDQVRSEGDIKATSDKVVSAAASCTFSGLRVAGQPVQQTTGGELPADQLKPLLDGVEQATQLKVEITPPTLTNTTIEGVKHVVDCSGVHISITDERTNTGVCSPAAPPQPPPDSGLPPAPQCVPPLGTRYELSFGHIAVQESVNAFPGGVADNGGGTSVEGLSVSANTPAGDIPASDIGVAPSTVNQTPFAAPPSTGTLRNGRGAINLKNAGTKLLGKNLAEMAALTGGAAVAIGLCVWLLLGVVDSLSKGTPLRLPGL
jgi:hypothetical protein